MIFEKSIKLLEMHLPEVTRAKLDLIACIATVRYEQKAALANTKRIKDGIKDGTIAKVFQE